MGTALTMAVLVSPTDPRAQAAIQIVVADAWKTFVDAEGRRSWGIPAGSRPGGFYRTTEDGCTCSDIRYRPWLVCKHILAVRMAIELEQEEFSF